MYGQHVTEILRYYDLALIALISECQSDLLDSSYVCISCDSSRVDSSRYAYR